MCVVLSPVIAGEGPTDSGDPQQTHQTSPQTRPTSTEAAQTTTWEGRPVAVWNPMGLLSDVYVSVACESTRPGRDMSKAWRVFHQRKGGAQGVDGEEREGGGGGEASEASQRRPLRCRRGWMSVNWDAPDAEGHCRVPVRPYSLVSLEVLEKRGATSYVQPTSGVVSSCTWSVSRRVSVNRIAGLLAGIVLFKLAPFLRESFGFRLLLGTTACSFGWLLLISFLAVQLLRPRIPGARLVALTGTSIAGVGASVRFLARNVVFPGVVEFARSPLVLGYLGVGVLVGFVVSYLLEERLSQAPRVLDLMQWVLQLCGVVLIWASVAHAEAAFAIAAFMAASNFIPRRKKRRHSAAVLRAASAFASGATPKAKTSPTMTSLKWRGRVTPDDVRRLGRSNSVGRVRPDLTFSASPTTPVSRRPVTPLREMPGTLERAGSTSSSLRGHRPSPPSASGSTAGGGSAGGAYGSRPSPPLSTGAWDVSPTASARDRSPLAAARPRDRSPLAAPGQRDRVLPPSARVTTPHFVSSLSPPVPATPATPATPAPLSPVVKMGKILNPTTGNLIKIDGDRYKALLEEGYTPDLVQGVLVASPATADATRSPSTPAARSTGSGSRATRSSARSSRLSSGGRR